MQKFKKSVRAFTLIELLIVISIVGAISAVVLTSFGSGQTRRELEVGAREFATVIREAQNYALSGKKLPGGGDPCVFGITWGGTSYDIIYKDEAGCGSASVTTLSSHTLQRGVVFLTASSSFFFTLPHANLSPVPGGGSYGITLRKGSQSQTVCVYTNGSVTDVSGSTCP